MANQFEVERVIGSGSVQELICQVIDLGQHAEEIKEIRKTVIIDNCQVVFDKVIIDGRLRKDILFKEARSGFAQPGNVQGCVGTVRTISGTLQDVDVDIAFNALISVPGVQPTDRCVVLQAFVEGEKEEAANIDREGTFTALIDKSIVFICIKVVREVTTGIAGGGGGQPPVAICPPRRSSGFFPGGNGTIPAPRPGLIPGTFIGPTLVFPGVLNPGIPSTIPFPNNIRSFTGSQVQINPPVTTTETGVTGPGGTIPGAGGTTV